MSKRLGNCLGPMTMPIFAANIIHNYTIWNFLETISMIPLASDHKHVFFNFAFKILGVETFTKGISNLIPRKYKPKFLITLTFRSIKKR